MFYKRAGHTIERATPKITKNHELQGSRSLDLLKARNVRAIDWKRHENNIYPKIAEWVEVIETVLQDPAILSENVYNMDETGVMLSKLGSVKVLVGRDDFRGYRGAGVKRTMMTAIECISADSRSLLTYL